MKYQHADDSSPEGVREHALAFAVVLRDCSLRPHMSYPTRRACRTVMRAQAIKWRQPAAGENGGRASV